MHAEGSVDPFQDAEIIHKELQLKDKEMMGLVTDTLAKVTVRGGGEKLEPEQDRRAKSNPGLRSTRDLLLLS